MPISSLFAYTRHVHKPLELLQRRRRDEDDEGHQVGPLENPERDGVQVEDADALGQRHGADGLQAGAVVGLLVLSVLHEPARQDVLLELQARDEMVVLAVDLVGALRAGGVWKSGKYPT